MPENAFDVATDQLDRVLGFFDRVEAKASTIFAVDTGLLALMALNTRPADLPVWYVTGPALVALALILASIYSVYRSSFPALNGGGGSLVYFREIAKRTEARFIEEHLTQTEDQRVRDVLAQVWRNSEILTIKFDNVKRAFTFAALAIIPWTVFLVVTAVRNASAPVLG